MVFNATSLFAQTAPAPSSAEVLAEAKIAAGGANLDGVRTLDIKSSIAQGGLTGKQEEWDDVMGGRYAVRFTLGPTIGGQGYDGSKPWSMDQSGQVTTPADADTVQSAVTDAYCVSLSFWYFNRMPGTATYLRHASEGGRDFDVLQISPKGGYPVEMWIDTKTHLIDRIVETLAEVTQTTFYSDYRLVSGTEQSFSQRETNGKPKYDSITKVDSVQVNGDIASSQFDVPKAQAPAFKIEGGASSVTVPFEYKDDHIFLPIKIDGHSYSAVFDTGGAYVMTPNVAKQLKLSPQGASESTGGGEGSVDTGFAKVKDVQIGGLTLQQPMFYVIPIPMLDTNPIIGFEILNQFVIKFDYDHNTMTLTDPDRFQYDGKGTVVPFRLNHTIPEVDGSVDGIKGVFTIDSGAGESLTLSSPFVAANGLFAKYNPKFTVIFGYGVGGPELAGVTRTTTLSLGDVNVHDLVTALGVAKAGSDANKIVAGNVGEGVLHRFNVTYDYTRQRLILEPNSHFADRDIYNRTGIILDPNATQAIVANVVPNSPADKAEIKVGDVIESMNGKAADYEAVRGALRGTIGSKIVLVVKSGQSSRSVTLTLEDLI